MIHRIVFISDTHLAHAQHPDHFPIIPAGDILVHAGDATWMGKEEEIVAFAEWFWKLPFRHKIFTPGNHDWGFQHKPDLYKNFLQTKDVHVLMDEAVTVEGIKFYGSPYSPRFGNWAFPLDCGRMAEDHWAAIPSDTDILLTHGGPLWTGDRVDRGDHVGCNELRKRVAVVRPKIHVFGHIHEAYGAYLERGDYADDISVKPGKTLFLNASICDLSYDPMNKPFEIDYETP